MRPFVLAARRRNGPHPLVGVDLRPGHLGDFGPPCPGQQHHLDGAIDGRVSGAGSPERGDLAVIEKAFPRLFLVWHLDAGARIDGKDVTLADQPGEKFVQQPEVRLACRACQQAYRAAPRRRASGCHARCGHARPATRSGERGWHTAAKVLGRSLTLPCLSKNSAARRATLSSARRASALPSVASLPVWRVPDHCRARPAPWPGWRQHAPPPASARHRRRG